MKKYKNDSSDQSIINEPFEVYDTSSSDALNVIEVIHNARRGVTMGHLSSLAKHMELTTTELARILHISLRSLHRYDDNKILDTDLSVIAIQLGRLRSMGLDVFGSDESFAMWLHSRLPALKGDRPVDYLDTTFGFQLIGQMLGRIEHGVFA